MQEAGVLMVTYEAAKLDPASLFKHPRDVLKERSLTHHQKIDVLRRWAYDEREMAVAEEENMAAASDPDKNNVLDEILKALAELGEKGDLPDHPPTKHGG